MRWSPHITVSTVLEQEGKLLFVEELIDGQRVINQPAGHWEDNETILEASVRETLEETAWTYEPDSIIGIYHWKHPANNETFLRFCFTGTLLTHEPGRTLDKEIIQAIWLSPDELAQRSVEHRSPLVSTCVNDYLSGQRFDLSVLKQY